MLKTISSSKILLIMMTIEAIMLSLMPLHNDNRYFNIKHRLGLEFQERIFLFLPQHSTAQETAHSSQLAHRSQQQTGESSQKTAADSSRLAVYSSRNTRFAIRYGEYILTAFSRSVIRTCGSAGHLMNQNQKAANSFYSQGNGTNTLCQLFERFYTAYCSRSIFVLSNETGSALLLSRIIITTLGFKKSMYNPCLHEKRFHI